MISPGKGCILKRNKFIDEPRTGIIVRFPQDTADIETSRKFQAGKTLMRTCTMIDH
jgi:hypothetical protein